MTPDPGIERPSPYAPTSAMVDRIADRGGGERPVTPVLPPNGHAPARSPAPRMTGTPEPGREAHSRG